jgi:hypothetical protein
MCLLDFIRLLRGYRWQRSQVLHVAAFVETPTVSHDFEDPSGKDSPNKSHSLFSGVSRVHQARQSLGDFYRIVLSKLILYCFQQRLAGHLSFRSRSSNDSTTLTHDFLKSNAAVNPEPRLRGDRVERLCSA